MTSCSLQSPLDGHLQLVDLTQAPLIHAHESIKKNENDVTAALETLHKEYQSVKTLLDRCVCVCARARMRATEFLSEEDQGSIILRNFLTAHNLS